MNKTTNLFWYDSDETQLHSMNDSGCFNLYRRGMLVGTLKYQDATWRFQYSEEYQKQTQYPAIVNFPSLEATYESEQLWPFFATRLPGSSELRELKEENSNLLELLRKFGQRVISNPYILMPIN